VGRIRGVLAESEAPRQLLAGKDDVKVPVKVGVEGRHPADTHGTASALATLSFLPDYY
jgi:hypothetical protein